MSEDEYLVIFETDAHHVHMRVVNTSPSWSGGDYCAEHTIPADDHASLLRVVRCWQSLDATFMMTDAAARQRYHELIKKGKE